jgi:uncharacterized metal-binding protein YceD (DUF177 family)
MTASDSAPQPEFSRPVSVSRLPPGGQFRVAAEPREREALARRFALVAIDRLEAEIRLTRLANAALRLDGRLDADVVQSCVVTLDPVPAHVADEFTIVFTPEIAAAREVELTGEEEAVEFLEGDTIDLGEAAAQQLSLALDPYPHAADATLPAEASTALLAEDHPFAALARLRRQP